MAFLRTVRSKYPNAVIFALRDVLQAVTLRETQTAVTDPEQRRRPQHLLRQHRRLAAQRRTQRQRASQRQGPSAIAARLAPIIAAGWAHRPRRTDTPPVTPTTARPSTVGTRHAPRRPPPRRPTTAAADHRRHRRIGGLPGDLRDHQSMAGRIPGRCDDPQCRSAAINGWTLHWSFANGQVISAGWNATLSQNGAAAQPETRPGTRPSRRPAPPPSASPPVGPRPTPSPPVSDSTVRSAPRSRATIRRCEGSASSPRTRLGPSGELPRPRTLGSPRRPIGAGTKVGVVELLHLQQALRGDLAVRDALEVAEVLEPLDPGVIDDEMSASSPGAAANAWASPGGTTTRSPRSAVTTCSPDSSCAVPSSR